MKTWKYEIPVSEILQSVLQIKTTIRTAGKNCLVPMAQHPVRQQHHASTPRNRYISFLAGKTKNIVIPVSIRQKLKNLSAAFS